MEKEWKANARGAGAKGQYEIRKSVIRMLLDGKSGQETAKLLGMELFYLPSYAPEYNPDGLLNSDVKRNAGSKTSPRSQKELESNVRSRLKKLQNNPAIGKCHKIIDTSR